MTAYKRHNKAHAISNIKIFKHKVLKCSASIWFN